MSALGYIFPTQYIESRVWETGNAY